MEKIELTIREKEVGAYLAAGLTAKQVARKLNISFHTVAGYQRVIKKKLQSKTLYQTGFLLSKLLVSDPIHTNQENVETVALNKPLQPKLAETVNQTLEQAESRANQGRIVQTMFLLF